MAESISNLIIAALSLLGAIVATLLAGLVIWTFCDIRARTRDPFVQVLATVTVAIIPIAGILVYLMLRPRETLHEQYVRALEEEALLASIENQEFCPACGRRVDHDMQFCPSCHTKLRNICNQCGRAVHLSWDLCPYCGNTLQPEMPRAATASHQRVTAASAPKPQPIPPAQPSPRAAPQLNAPALESAAEEEDWLVRIGDRVASLMDRIRARTQATSPAALAERPPQSARPAPPTTDSTSDTTRTVTNRKPLISREELE
ncbi:MAG: double zinc ribbon domain-containing protein [Thermoflexales bacterium]